MDQQNALAARLRAALPAALRPHLAAVRLDGADLSLFVGSPAWRARFRFYAPQLLGAVGAVTPPATRVRVKVRLPEHRQERRRVARLSDAAAAALNGAADGISDPALRGALRRLAACAADPG